ncbi:hypothetical protein [Oscillatoria sp. FACHB-1406]|uniref:hypothetical protein n=1 Tax=Oscillatoria sp. FACHB-1406 TaxID=2692846 RepID=UPI00168465C6|nr:hypothetical protein [Oscillatoria sp. FACHB-1406]MBD2580181.1 hypothetical protein [Oscillatoria sp. FACHB-1406]
MRQLQTLSPEIRETAQELQLLLERQKCLEERDKVAALYLLKLGRINNFHDLAKTIGQDIETLESWFRVYSTQGLCALLRY